MFCAKCGKGLQEGIKFCSGCGEKTESKVETRPQMEARPEVVIPAAQSQGKPIYTPQQQPYGSTQQLTQNLSVGDYIGIILLMGIPFVNIILLLIWAFSGSTNINRKNFAKAWLILSVIGVVLWIIFIVIIGVSGGALMRSLSDSMY